MKTANVFSSVEVLNEFDLRYDFVQTFKDLFIQRTRGFGYWSWKPEIIYQQLTKLRDGDYLVYSDVGNEFDFSKSHRLDTYIDLLDSAPIPILSPVLSNGFAEKQWTKKELLEYFDLLTKQNIIDKPQYEANFLLMKNCTITRKFITDWQNVFFKDIRLIDDSISTSQLDCFIDHRHDQSVFSLLGKMFGTVTIPMEQDDFVLRKRLKVYRPNIIKKIAFLIKNNLFLHYWLKSTGV